MTKKQKEMIQKEKDLQFIEQFRDVSVKNVCEDLGINYSNVMNGNASCRKIRRVKKEIERRIELWLHRYD